MFKDCRYRQGHKCLKLNKNVPIDMREPDTPRCWLQPKTSFIDGCRDYEEMS